MRLLPSRPLLIAVVPLVLAGASLLAHIQTVTRPPAGTPVVRAVSAAAPARVDVLTQHNDNDRTGWNAREALLTPRSVTPSTFGRLFDLPVDGLVYAQPLVVTDVEVGGKRRDVVVIVTEHNSVFVFDAESGEPLWTENYGPSIPTPNRFWNTAWGVYLDLTPEVGITSTPVVDRTTMTVYFTTATWRAAPGRESELARIWENDAEAPIVTYHLHAVDLRTHLEKFGAPMRVEGSVPLVASHSGRHGAAARLAFNPMQHLQRPALLQVNGRIVLAFGGHADQVPYQGWVFSYAAGDLTSAPWVWSSMAGGAATQVNGSGIWQAGMGLTADDAGNVLLVTGNGNFDPAAQQFGDSVVKLSMKDGLSVADYFTPCNQECLDANDGDLGSSGIVRVPGTNRFLIGGKLGRIFVLDGARLGKFTSPPAARCASACSDRNVFECQNRAILQEFQAGCDIPKNTATVAPPTPCAKPEVGARPPAGNCPPLTYQAVGHHIHGAPVYWRGSRRGAAIYVWAENDVLRAFPMDAATSRFTATGCGPRPPALAWTLGREASPAGLHNGMTGGILSLSSNGGNDGIVWSTTPTNNDANQRVVPGILRAYDATDLRRELWNSYLSPERDDFGNFAKHTPPTVANGKVYVATFSNHVSVYGLRSRDSRQASGLRPQTSAVAPPPPGELLQNGDFEQGPAGWTFDGPGEVNDSFPYWGIKQGALCPTPQRAASLRQEVQTPETGTYALVARLATNIRLSNIRQAGADGAVTLRVHVDGRQAGQASDVTAFAGYQRVAIEFSASRGARIRVSYEAPPAAPLPYFGITPAISQPAAYAVIDTVSLTRREPQR